MDDDEEEEDKLHAMLSMICSRNLTAPNPMKGFYPSPLPDPPHPPAPTPLGPPATHRRGSNGSVGIMGLAPRRQIRAGGRRCWPEGIVQNAGGSGLQTECVRRGKRFTGRKVDDFVLSWRNGF